MCTGVILGNSSIDGDMKLGLGFSQTLSRHHGIDWRKKDPNEKLEYIEDMELQYITAQQQIDDYEFQLSERDQSREDRSEQGALRAQTGASGIEMEGSPQDEMDQMLARQHEDAQQRSESQKISDIQYPLKKGKVKLSTQQAEYEVNHPSQRHDAQEDSSGEGSWNSIDDTIKGVDNIIVDGSDLLHDAGSVAGDLLGDVEEGLGDVWDWATGWI